MEVTKVLIPCKANKGMFDNEAAVELETPDGQKLSFFADRTLIHQIGSRTYLEVALVNSDNAAKESTVLLPSESFEKGSRWLRVPSNALEPA